MSTTVLEIRLPVLEKKLDAIITLLGGLHAHDCHKCTESVAQCAAAIGAEVGAEAAARLANGGAPESPTAPQSAATPAPEEINHPADEISPFPEPEAAAPAEEPKPAITLEQIQQKVLQLATANGGTKKAKAREIVNAYARKVSDLPQDKWAEVWDKLTELEGQA